MRAASARTRARAIYACSEQLPLASGEQYTRAACSFRWPPAKMQTVSSLLAVFGFGSENTGIPEGRRRFVGLLSFLSFALILAATCSQNWVAGSIDFPVDGAEVSATAHFRVDLSRVVIEFARSGDAWSPSGITAFVQYPRKDWVARQIAAATTPNCVIGQVDVVPGDRNYWCGLPIQNFNRDIDATYGLWVFSCILVTVAWLMSWSLMAGSTAFENPLSFKVLGGLLAGAAFFSVVGLITFAASKISTTFCAVFEGPVNESNDTILNCERAQYRARCRAYRADAPAVFPRHRAPPPSSFPRRLRLPRRVCPCNRRLGYHGRRRVALVVLDALVAAVGVGGRRADLFGDCQRRRRFLVRLRKHRRGPPQQVHRLQLGLATCACLPPALPLSLSLPPFFSKPGPPNPLSHPTPLPRTLQCRRR